MQNNVIGLTVDRLHQGCDVAATAGTAHYSASHNCFVFIIQTNGSCMLRIGADEIDISGAAVFCIAPGEAGYHFSYQKNIAGWMISIGEEWMAPHLQDIFRQEAFNIIPVNTAGRPAIRLCNRMKLLYNVIKDRQRTTRADTGVALASICIEQIARIYLEQVQVQDADSHRDRVTLLFYDLLRGNNHRQWKKPLQYAASLKMSSSYLNECVQHSTGMSVGYWIQYETIQEAKEVLIQSRAGINEVATSFGFESHAYFSRMFFQVTGMSPRRFRETYIP